MLVSVTPREREGIRFIKYLEKHSGVKMDDEAALEQWRELDDEGKFQIELIYSAMGGE